MKSRPVIAIAVGLLLLGMVLAYLNAQSEKLNPGSTFRDCSTCPLMVVLPMGSFGMGSPATEIGRAENEDVVHEVTFSKSFAIGKTEITRGMFAEFVRETAYDAGNSCYTLEHHVWAERVGRNWKHPGFEQQANHPVSCINWNDALAYTQWLTRKTGKTYRLPTEAEWEYAARGNSISARYWGENPALACKFANVRDDSVKSLGMIGDAYPCNDGFSYTAPVGKFKENSFGLNDMLGNVWEWVEDSYHANYNGAPVDGRVWKGDSAPRVVRGGSWLGVIRTVRAASRTPIPAQMRFSNGGFRVTRTQH